MGPERLAAVLDEGGVVVDLRDRDAFARGHVPGTLSIPAGADFPNWAGWLLPYDRPVHLISGTEQAAVEAARDLALIGIDRIAGWFGPDALDRWEEERGGLETHLVTDWAEAEAMVAAGDAVLVDVRREAEWNEGHVPGARHVHLGYLADRADELPDDTTILLYCRTGNRSGIGAGLLQRAGRQAVGNVEGGVVDRARLGLPLEARPDAGVPIGGNGKLASG
jgi:hydroxyacylglutathione hydrolase